MEKNQSFENILIAIHGVGSQDPKSVLNPIVETLNSNGDYKTISVNGNNYETFETYNKKVKVLEVMWDHIQKPTKFLPDVFKHIVFLLSAMLSHVERNNTSMLVRLIRGVLEGLFIGGSIMSAGFIAFNHACLKNLAIHIFLLAAVFSIAHFGKKISKYFSLGYWNAILYSVIILLWFLRILEFDTIKLVFSCYSIAILLLLGISWFIITIKAYYKSKKKVNHVNSAMLSISFIGFNAITTLIFLILFSFAPTDYRSDINLFAIEMLGLIVYGILGLLPIIFFAFRFAFYPNEVDKGNENLKGQLLRRYLYYYIHILNIAMVVLFFGYIFIIIEPLLLNPIPWIHFDKSVFQIYRISSLRIIPFVIWIFINPLRLLIDVTGDVLYYLENDSNLLYFNKQKVNNQLKAIVKYCNDNYKGAKKIILAHSWGSQVSNEEILSNNYFKGDLITIGSPIQVLAFDFLGEEIKNPNENIKWFNYYRWADPIGGPINIENIKNKLIGEGGHTNYWKFDKLINKLNNDHFIKTKN